MQLSGLHLCLRALVQTKNERSCEMLMKPNQFELDVWTSAALPRTQDSLFMRLISRLEAYIEHRRQRRALRSMDDRLLRDIGLNRSEAERIAGEPFHWWREPK